MMKKMLLTAMVIMMMAAPMAQAQSVDAEAAARAYVSQGAVLTEQETEGTLTELEFSDAEAGAEYDVLLDAATGAVVRVKTSYREEKREYQASMDEEAARAAMALIRPEAVINYALLERDDGHDEWKLFLTEGEALYAYTLAADTGDVLEIEELPGAAAGTLSADLAVAALKTAKGEAEVEDMDFDVNEQTGAVGYEGEATLAGARYEFELGAAGEVLKWEAED